MIESLIERVWKNPLLTDGLLKLERDWISRSTGADAVGERFEVSAGPRYLEAAAILACSSDARHRLAAYRIATYSHDLFRQQIDGIDAAVRVVLTRLGNFPGLATSDAINQAGGALPLALVT